ncbi:ArsR/SmtB family transcription factor [Salinisphaera japonica]|uniref:ArsR family transcriptional regulator n=1 Tax=Salinisphaera japonica YTM-1 TaxID=1209778 RepID=A0A423PYI4_9GAMM|nr:metalloregulator ArsR/SmtB family transcription factor [Salinisphaera japonica]ROO30666.1 ArsR family transcriptional regulator [Salinisphaera japonica YTM-1]
MDESIAIARFAALAQETRLAVFRLLVTAEPDGLAAGEIARRLAVPHNTMSAHLAVLTRAGLATATRHSRSMIYRAELGAVRETLFYLARDCCNGRPEVCAGLVDALVEAPAETKT